MFKNWNIEIWLKIKNWKLKILQIGSKFNLGCYLKKENKINRSSKRSTHCGNPPTKENIPNIDKNQKISSIIAIVRRKPGSIKITQISSPNINMLCKEKGLPEIENNVQLSKGKCKNPKTQSTNKTPKIQAIIRILLQKYHGYHKYHKLSCPLDKGECPAGQGDLTPPIWLPASKAL